MPNRLAFNVSLLLIIVQELSTGELVFSEKLHYALSENVDTCLDDFPEWIDLLQKARDLHQKILSNGGYQPKIYRFYGLYHDEPQSYDGQTTAMIPAGASEYEQERYATAAAALKLIIDNENEDILTNFTLENIYQENNALHNINEAHQILLQLVRGIENSGGLISSQGNYFLPNNELDRPGLGNTIHLAHQYLVKAGEMSANELTIS